MSIVSGMPSSDQNLAAHGPGAMTTCSPTSIGPALVSSADAEPSPRELGAYNYFRDNVAGVQREWWFHRSGCGEWFLAERDTRTNAVLLTELPS